ncbi:MAG: ABC transporter substrate-binding protein [Rickettsiales bacterium]|nr:MAG: ABC transporter substrate-binding protein [Rickettsiales bacterium]
MKKIFQVYCLSLLMCIQICYAYEKNIAINQYVSHVALDAAYHGFIDGIEKEGLKDKIKIIFGNAQGNLGNSIQISKQHASLMPDFMVSISSLSTQTNYKVKNDKTILAFLAVSDPNALSLNDSKNIIGVTDNPPIVELIEKTLLILPKVKTIGVIYNSGEINSVNAVETLEKTLKLYSIALKKVTITNSNDIKNAMNKLIGMVEAIYLPQDNSVISALNNIVNIANTNNVPLIANDPTLVKEGIFMALGSNYYESGIQLANMIAQIIDGTKLEQPIQQAKVKEFKINFDLAKKLNITIPENTIGQVSP